MRFTTSRCDACGEVLGAWSTEVGRVAAGVSYERTSDAIDVLGFGEAPPPERLDFHAECLRRILEAAAAARASS